MSKVLIIAEAGVNHNGSIELAKQLIDVASEAKVDYVKFQTFKADTIVSPSAKKADYQSINTRDYEESQYDMLIKLELNANDHDELIAYCKSKSVKFLSSAFDVEGVKYLDGLGLELFKVPSGEITNYPYLKAIAKTNKPVILSTGMANIEDIEAALEVLLKYGANKEEITILHCNTEYPTPMKDVNLLAMNSIKSKFNVNIGYSDHTLGIEVPIAAVALGAKVIEKHFTLDRNLPGPDHLASLEPKELKDMVKAIRNIEKAISGNGIKEPSPSELKNKAVARKSIVASNYIAKGDIYSEDNLTVKRPGNGISPMQWNNILGKTAKRDYNEDEQIEKL